MNPWRRWIRDGVILVVCLALLGGLLTATAIALATAVDRGLSFLGARP